MEEKYGKLTIIERVDAPEHVKSKSSIYYLCKCDCGNRRIVRKYGLVSGKTTSCGCERSRINSEKGRNVKHGLSHTRFFSIWSNMKKRCENPKHNQYHNYGAKGVKVCDRWLTFQNFIDDMYQSYIIFENEHGEDSATIDRIDSNGDYEPSNCKWASQLEQARNRSNNISLIVDGIEYDTLSEVAEKYNIEYSTLIRRYNRGLRNLELVEQPKESARRNKKGKVKGIETEVNGKHYNSIQELHKDYPYISAVSLQKRYHKGLRGDDLIRRPRAKSNS